MMSRPSGFLGISVEADGPEAADGPSSAPLEQLLELLNSLGFGATWVFAHPGRSDWARRLTREGSGHEVALAGDASWIGAVAGRTRFARELKLRIEEAQAAGMTIDTLALRSAELTEHLDLLVKQRIRLIRRTLDPALRPTLYFEPQSTRFGVWRVPSPVLFPGNAPWWFGGDDFRLRHWAQRAIHARAVMHVAVDGSSLDAANLRSMRRFLTHVRDLSAHGSIQVERLSRISDWLLAAESRGARSIQSAA